MRYWFILLLSGVLSACSGSSGSDSSTSDDTEPQGSQQSAQNSAPTAVADAFQFTNIDSIVLTYEQLLANDSDSDNDTLSLVSIDNVTNGVCQLDSQLRQVTCEYEAAFVGTLSFDYRVEDEQGGHAEASVNINLIAASSVEPVINVDSRTTFIFGHSLIFHATDTSQTTVPYWLHRLVDLEQKSFAFSGQYGFLMQHDDLPPYPQWGIAEYQAAWSDDTGESYSDVGFDSILLTAANFVQYKAPTEPYDGDNPDQTSPVASTLDIVDWLVAENANIDIYVYENWQDMSIEFPPTPQQLDAYHAETVNADEGGFHHWWLTYHDELVSARPGVSIKMIPVGPILSQLLTQTNLKDIAVTELYEDNAPHGRETIYFLAALITYSAMYGEIAPQFNEFPPTVHSLVQSNYSQITQFIWNALTDFNFSDGSSRVF